MDHVVITIPAGIISCLHTRRRPNAKPMIPKQYTLSKPDDLCTTYYYPEEASPACMDLSMRPLTPPSTTMTFSSSTCFSDHRRGLWCVGLMALRPSCMDSWWNSFLTGLYHADTSM